jgi:DNA-binding MarR family transcriptional regulator
MIRNLLVKRRLQSAAVSTNRFMAECNHLGEAIEAPARSDPGAPRLGPSSAQLKELLKARRARSDFFGAHLFADPAWDILLMAYVTLLDQERQLVSTLLRTSLVPATTLLRWIKTLQHDGWLERTEDPIEGPRAVLELSTAGKAGMERYLAAVWPSLPL